MPAHAANAGASVLERSVATQHLRRQMEADGGVMPPPPPPLQPGRLQQLSLNAPALRWLPGPEDAGSSRSRRGGSNGGGDGGNPAQAEFAAAWDENARLVAENASLDAELADLEARAERSVLEMAQMRRVLTQLKAHKEAFSLAPEQNIAAALAAVKSLSAEELASDSATDAALSDGARRRPRGGKRRCMGAANDSDDEEEVDPAEAARLAEEAADARAAAALTVSGGDPAQALIHLLDLYVRSQTGHVQEE